MAEIQEAGILTPFPNLEQPILSRVSVYFSFLFVVNALLKKIEVIGNHARSSGASVGLGKALQLTQAVNVMRGRHGGLQLIVAVIAAGQEAASARRYGRHTVLHARIRAGVHDPVHGLGQVEDLGRQLIVAVRQGSSY